MVNKVNCKDCNEFLIGYSKCDYCKGIICKKCKITRADKTYCYTCYTDNLMDWSEYT